jgi:glycosyltransferase involved in cell wall biosynthesis
MLNGGFMPEGLSESLPEEAVRPVLLLDKPVFMAYSSYIRRILVGFTGTVHTTALVCPSDLDSGEILCPSVEFVEHPALRLAILRQQNRKILLSRLLRFKPTIIHTFYPGQVRLAHWLSRQLDIPFVVTCHKELSRWTMTNRVLSQAAGMTAPSQRISDRIYGRCSGVKDRIDRIHIGSFVEDRCSCYSRSGNVTSFIVSQSLNSFKTFEPFLNAVRHLALDGFEVMVALMGRGKAEKAIRSHIRSLGLTAIVTVVPPIRPIRDVLCGADVYVQLSDTGAFDAQLLEAMAVGLAVVGVPEKTSGLLEENQTAFFWDSKDELDIYNTLKQLLSAREQTRRIAINAQHYLKEHHSVSGMVNRLITTYAKAQQWHKQKRDIQEQVPVSQPVP